MTLSSSILLRSMPPRSRQQMIDPGKQACRVRDGACTVELQASRARDQALLIGAHGFRLMDVCRPVRRRYSDVLLSHLEGLLLYHICTTSVPSRSNGMCRNGMSCCTTCDRIPRSTSLSFGRESPRLRHLCHRDNSNGDREDLRNSMMVVVHGIAWRPAPASDGELLSDRPKFDIIDKAVLSNDSIGMLKQHDCHLHAESFLQPVF